MIVSRSLRTYLILAAFIALKALGNLSLAFGARHLTEGLSFDPFGYFRAMLSPYVTVGILMLMISLLTRMALLSVADLSFVLPMTAIGYIISVLTGKLFLHEQVSASRWLGALLIFSATFLVGSTPQNTTTPPVPEPSAQPVAAD
ncbi:MAG TPA: hypothetical protein VHZ55_26635 [Bryobacteraceae bacterium]|jgi:drug/metabolite transporter (DMT)-like permease|nr:hypothetical protein [Bryobacteraceae bacterium]